ncbi:MAG: caspase family protein [Scytonema sp. PMC 1069.18]|nr:caspase family protein [Scytonema sp. PMC 1069.18]
MSQIKRRHFLQFAGSTLATMGLSQLDIMQQGDKYAKVLAQKTSRKLALLVGINEYQNDPLRGCVNDVLLQKELLTHRFGFNPNDIRILTDAQATRQNILTTFEEHLINQAKPGDVVVFHFSGHGSRVVDPDKDTPDGLNSTLVPIDSGLPQEYPSKGGIVQDIMGHTLFLLMYALKTDNVTVVLDSCHSGGAKRGNFVVRSALLQAVPGLSRDGGEKLQASPNEMEYQRQWLKRLNLSQQQFINLRRQGVAKGVVIASAKSDQFAVDTSFNDFSAGAFTYLFTQYLWQQPINESVKRILVDVSRSTQIFSRQKGYFQNPELESNIKQNSNPPIYFAPFSTSYGEAVVTQTQGDRVQLWLGGVDSQSLEAFNKDTASFSIVDANGRETGLIKLESRKGLIGQGKLVNAARGNAQLKPGTLLQERIKGIPSDLTLKIGIDDSFDANTTTQVQQALQSIKRVSPLPLRQQEVQYIFGRMTEARYQELQKLKTSNLPAPGSFGLFLPTLDQIVPNSFGNANETIVAAAQRLQPKFKSLLATRIVKQMLGNTNTSQVKVTASMNIAGSKQITSETLTVRGMAKKQGASSTTSAKPINITDGSIPKLSIGTQVVFQIENKESAPLYISILVIDATGEMAIIFPNDWSASEDSALLTANDKRIIPGQDDGFTLTIGEPLGITEALIVASTTPLRTSLKALKEIAKRGNTTRGPLATNNDEFLDVADKLLEDLDAGTRGGINVEGIQLPAGVRGVDTKKLAAMAITFEVVS